MPTRCTDLLIGRIGAETCIIAANNNAVSMSLPTDDRDLWQPHLALVMIFPSQQYISVGQMLKAQSMRQFEGSAVTAQDSTLTRALTPIDCDWANDRKLDTQNSRATGPNRGLPTHSHPVKSIALLGNWDEPREGRNRSLVTPSFAPPDLLSTPATTSLPQIR